MTDIERSTTVNAHAQRVWEAFADFGGVDGWHPYFERAAIEGERSRGVGAARVCDFGPKMAIRETAIEWDDARRYMAIEIDFIRGAAPPIRDALASVMVTPAGDSSCTLTLRMHYQTTLGPIGWLLDQVMIKRQYASVFENMLAAVKGYVEEGRAPAPIAMPGSGRVLTTA